MKDSDEMEERAPRLPAVLLAAAALLIGFIGIGWGLPSMSRNCLYFSLGQDVPSVDRKIVENSWRHFPEFGWLEQNKSTDNLQGQIRRSLFSGSRGSRSRSRDTTRAPPRLAANSRTAE